MQAIGNTSKMQDNELVELLKNGSQEAFKELYDRYKEVVIRVSKKFLKDTDSAEDILHDIFLQVWEKRETLNPELSFSGYLYTLTKNTILNEMRHAKTQASFVQNILMTEDDSTNQTYDKVIENDYAKLLNVIINSLSPAQKEVYQLSHIQGFTHKEIAERMKISVNTVNVHATLALKKIRKYLTRYADIHFK